MRLLLDTHVALWSVSEPERVSPDIRRLITDHETENFVSVASLWEIAIKHALKRRPQVMSVSASEAALEFEAAGFSLLDITAEHALAVEMLPPIHGDPFDRLLVAQALTEPMRLVTHDAVLARYSDVVIAF